MCSLRRRHRSRVREVQALRLRDSRSTEKEPSGKARGERNRAFGTAYRVHRTRRCLCGDYQIIPMKIETEHWTWRHS